MRRKISFEESDVLIKRAQQLCEELQREASPLGDVNAEAWAMTVLVHATALQAAFTIGAGAPRGRVLECTAIAQKQLGGAIGFYHRQFEKIQAAMTGRPN